MFDWQMIVKEHGPAVWQTAYRLLGNRDDTADCFQEAFLAAVEVSRRQRVHSISGLLVHLATTRAIDRLRQRMREGRYQGSDVLSDDRRDRTPCDPARQVLNAELGERLREAIAELPPPEARAFCLRYFSEMSYREVARALNIKTSAAGVLLHRAKAKLRQAFDAERMETDEVPS